VDYCGRTGKRRRGVGKGTGRRLGEERRREGKGGGEGMDPHFLDQIYARGSE